MKTRKTSGLSALQNILLTVVIILFFLGIITVYYVMLYSETRENIIRSGEINAISSSNRINRYLSTGVDAIKLTAYTLDNMIRDGRSQEEFQVYLENQSVATSNIVSGQSNGIYAYIGGEYLDGENWVPDEGYEPTQRPWYRDAIGNTGKVVVVDPYLDAQTGMTMITLAKTLCDAKSVVAMDISMEQLQEITEDIAADGHSEMEIVLDRSYAVVAHSDRTELGKHYTATSGSLENVLAARLRELGEGQNYFSLQYGSKVYIVYVMTIENDWTCLSVIDATEAFSRLKTPLILMIVASVLIIAVLLSVMIYSQRRNAFASEMQQLAERQTAYAYYDQLTGLKNRRAYSEAAEQLSKGIPKDWCLILFDVNGLKTVNDTRGHKAGDELLCAAAQCIRRAFDGTDAVYRLGGDEFCVMLSDPDGRAEDALGRLDRMTADWQGQQIGSFTISYGMATGRESTDWDAMVRAADLKMYAHKEQYYRTLHGQAAVSEAWK
ncbi:MAG: diguanylate cyclase [Oscillospiraceae bacterium]|nr:diguanylate cyclase [Oscillospiraceae bacterium]